MESGEQPAAWVSKSGLKRMRLFRVKVTSRAGKAQRLLVAAEDESEARFLAGRQGRVEEVHAKTGPCRLFGNSRVIGSVLQELTS